MVLGFAEIAPAVVGPGQLGARDLTEAAHRPLSWTICHSLGGNSIVLGSVEMPHVGGRGLGVLWGGRAGNLRATRTGNAAVVYVGEASTPRLLCRNVAGTATAVGVA